MADQPAPRWYQTIPGAIGALATLITALTGLVIALQQLGVFGSKAAPSAPTNAVTAKTVDKVGVARSAERKSADAATSDFRREVVATQGNGDSIRIIDISPSPSQKLRTGAEVPFTVRVHYVLASTEAARLVFQIVQFDKNFDDGCFGNGHIPVGNGASITRGQGEVELQVVWHGGRSKGLQADQGHVAPMFSIWHATDHDVISNFPAIREACYQFVSA